MFSKRKLLVFAVVVAGLLGTSFLQVYLPKAMAAQAGLYVVQKGDTLSEIGAKYGVSVLDLQKTNKLEGTLIVIGQNLIIPDSITHEVKKGENLSVIAGKYKTTIEEIKQVNGLSKDEIYPGNCLMIPKRQHYSASTIATTVSYKQKIQQKFLEVEEKLTAQQLNSTPESNLSNQDTYSAEDCYLLAKLIHAEARGESRQGRIAVGAVILNRLASPDFPKTIKEIIYQQKGHVYQFSPVEDGSINLEPNQEAWEAAKAALAGEDPTNGSVFFYNPDIATDEWIKTLPVSKVIGNHVFAR